jgi:hypothetical protein
MRVCACVNRFGRANPRYYNGSKWLCSVCDGYIKDGIQIFSWECFNCKKEFIKNFRHPAYSFDNPMCWFCLEELLPDFVAYNYVVQFKKVPPPKPITDEELFSFSVEG